MVSRHRRVLEQASKSASLLIKSLGHTQCVLDTCFYYKYKNGQIDLMAVLYVDDIMIMSVDLECKKLVDRFGFIGIYCIYAHSDITLRFHQSDPEDTFTSISHFSCDVCLFFS
jgi:hypothetical protein